MSSDPTRRQFLRTTVGLGLGLGLTGTSLLAQGTKTAPVRETGMPLGKYGRTGIPIPRIILGAGSRFCTLQDPEVSDQLLNHALDHGLFFWDSAAIYEDTRRGVNSEERLARVLAKRRREVFLSTKVTAREPDAARRQIEASLKKLGVAQLDQLMIHDVHSTEDNADLRRKGHLIDLVHEMKATGVTRFIGFSGHATVDSLRELVEHYDFDSLLMALDHWGNRREPREETVLPLAKAKGMAVFVMKAVRPREKDKSLNPNELVRYALSLPQPDAVVLGIDSMEILQANIDILRGFEPLPAPDMQRIAQAWQRFQPGENAPWRQHGYVDGRWA